MGGALGWCHCSAVLENWYYHANSIVGSITCRIILHVLFLTIHHHYITYCNVILLQLFEVNSTCKLLAMPKITIGFTSCSIKLLIPNVTVNWHYLYKAVTTALLDFIWC